LSDGEINMRKLDAFKKLLSDDALSVDDQVQLLTELPEDSISSDVLAACVDYALSQAIRVNIDAPGAIDLVGTGGDKSGTFNISTTATLVAAGAGAPVLKHGNRAATSLSGSFDLLDALDIPIPKTPKEVQTQFDACGVAFIFARFFHPSFANVAAARKQLAKTGHRSIFNLLGPLLNPAGVKRFVIGVYDKALLSPFAETLSAMHVEKAMVCFGSGLDELGLSDNNRVIDIAKGQLTHATLDVATLGLRYAGIDKIQGGDSEFNAKMTESILSGEDKGPARDIVLLNAAAAISVSKDITLEVALIQANQALLSGDAMTVLTRLQETKL